MTHALTFYGLPPFNQCQPEGPVFGIAGGSGKAAAFIGTSAEFVVRSGLSGFHGKVFVLRGVKAIQEQIGNKVKGRSAEVFGNQHFGR